MIRPRRFLPTVSPGHAPCVCVVFLNLVSSSRSEFIRVETNLCLGNVTMAYRRTKVWGRVSNRWQAWSALTETRAEGDMRPPQGPVKRKMFAPSIQEHVQFCPQRRKGPERFPFISSTGVYKWGPRMDFFVGYWRRESENLRIHTKSSECGSISLPAGGY